MNVLKSKKEKITLYFGNQKLNGKPYNHTGIDIIKSPSNLDYIIACFAGIVEKVVSNVKRSTNYMSYGNYVIINHGNGYKSLYAHLKYATIKVKKGQKVKAGDVIGYMGATGYVTGAHLHFEIRKNNKQINPLPYLEDKKSMEAVKEEYTTGDYKTNYVMKVRVGAGTNYRVKKKKELTVDGQRNATILGRYKKGTIFTAQKIIKNNDGSYWAKTPSGYICLKDKKNKYCTKI